jgi:hypothetical protein
LEYPFSTIEQARDYLRKSFRSSFPRVVLYPTYHFIKDHTLTFDERDYLKIYTKMTENERNQIHLSRRYLGQSKSSGPGTLFSYNRLIEIFFPYETIEKTKLYFSMLFDRHSTVNPFTAIRFS